MGSKLFAQRRRFAEQTTATWLSSRVVVWALYGHYDSRLGRGHLTSFDALNGLCIDRHDTLGVHCGRDTRHRAFVQWYDFLLQVFLLEPELGDVPPILKDDDDFHQGVMLQRILYLVGRGFVAQQLDHIGLDAKLGLGVEVWPDV